MTKTTQSLAVETAKLRNRLARLSFDANSMTLIAGNELNMFRTELAGALTMLGNIDYLLTHREHEQTVLRQELDKIGNHIVDIQHKLDPDLVVRAERVLKHPEPKTTAPAHDEHESKPADYTDFQRTANPYD